jgi:hypothetical protein
MFSILKSLILTVGLTSYRVAFERENITEFVKQKDGTIFSTHNKISPIFSVEVITLSRNTTIPPIPAKTKCKKIVTV